MDSLTPPFMVTSYGVPAPWMPLGWAGLVFSVPLVLAVLAFLALMALILSGRTRRHRRIFLSCLAVMLIAPLLSLTAVTSYMRGILLGGQQEARMAVNDNLLIGYAHFLIDSIAYPQMKESGQLACFREQSLRLASLSLAAAEKTQPRSPELSRTAGLARVNGEIDRFFSVAGRTYRHWRVSMGMMRMAYVLAFVRGAAGSPGLTVQTVDLSPQDTYKLLPQISMLQDISMRIDPQIIRLRLHGGMLGEDECSAMNAALMAQLAVYGYRANSCRIVKASDQAATSKTEEDSQHIAELDFERVWTAPPGTHPQADPNNIGIMDLAQTCGISIPNPAPPSSAEQGRAP
ncbi:MAG: hypothetical protein IPI58_05405 [Alphaproteobacteria bacterium]|nr:MAG: hypothetical protein IPI58_05405 [Alphaproteobacteria bacterium]